MRLWRELQHLGEYRMEKTELHSFVSTDKEFEAKVFIYEDQFSAYRHVVEVYREGAHTATYDFNNENMAKYWADDCVIDYELARVANRGEN